MGAVSGDVVARAKAALVGVTDGPWLWTSPRYGVPTLEGRAGDPELYRYDTEVLEVDHHGECGCRSACELELTVSDADKAFIAAARDLVPELVAEVERLRAIVDGRVVLDREYTDEELRNSPYVGVVQDAVVVGPDEYRSGPGFVGGGQVPGVAGPVGPVGSGRMQQIAMGPVRCRRCGEVQ